MGALTVLRTMSKVFASFSNALPSPVAT